MNNKIYKWLAVTLLLSVSVFCFLYLTKLQKADIADTAVAETENTEDIITEKPVADKPVYYNVLPRKAAAIDNTLVQNIGGANDEILKSVYTVADKTYLFFDSASNGYDIKTDKPSVVCAVLDKDLTLLKTVTLSGKNAEAFASSKITADGFFAATVADDYVAVYKVNFDLVTLGELILPAANGVRLYLFGDKPYVISELADSLQITVTNQNLIVEKSFSVFCDNPKIVDIFPTKFGLNIIANTASGYALLRYTADGGFTAINAVNNQTIDTILPYNGGFAGLKTTADGLVLFTADANLAETNRTVLAADSADLFISDSNLAVYARTVNSAEVKIFCEHLAGIVTRPAKYYQNFIYRDYSGDTVIANGEDTVFVLKFDGLDFVTAAEYSGTSDYAYLSYDNSVCLSSAYKSGIYKNNFGMNDIFIIKSLGQVE